MARATIGGSVPVGGWRRPCRSLLPALLVLAVLIPHPVAAGSVADAWASARSLHTTSSAAVQRAATSFSDGGDLRDLQTLRSIVVDAIHAMDALDVHDCFRVWWSYARTSYVMYDLALMNIQMGQVERAQSATASGMFLASMADATVVDCSRSQNPFSTEGARHRSGDNALLSVVG